MCGLDGETLPKSRYHATPGELSVAGVPARFELETLVRIHPEQNTALSGLYRTSGNYCTQCEAMGFRRITYFLDRPDVMARFTTTITADRETCPVMLSNGNRVLRGDPRRAMVGIACAGIDPFPKPSYLFALVAGDLRCHGVAASRRPAAARWQLEIWVEAQNIDRCEHAFRSLQKAMKWDEEVFGLEYDLDVYMIVAVNDFNMGAMENKGLNVFNSKYVLGPSRDGHRRRLRGHRGGDRSRVLPQLDRQSCDLPGLVPAHAEGGADGLSRSALQRRHDVGGGQAHRRRQGVAHRAVRRGRWAHGPSDSSRVLYLHGQLLYGHRLQQGRRGDSA